MKRDTKERGITLIALVITIIVLLILAGISLAMITGDNGLLIKMSNAKEKNENSAILEQLRLILYEQEMEKLDNNISKEEYLEAKGIITKVTTEVSELKRYASVSGEIKLSLADVENATNPEYIVNVEKLLPDLNTGKGNLENGDVYYLANGNLYYMSAKKEELTIGKVYNTNGNSVVADASYFNYREINNNEVEIIGLDFRNINYEKTRSFAFYANKELESVKWNIGTLMIPEKIDGKDVTKVSFYNNITNWGCSSSNDGTKVYILQGISEIKYPSKLKVLGGTEVLFEDINAISLPNDLEELSLSYYYIGKSNSVTIPTSVKRLYGMVGNDIYIEGKNSIEDFEGYINRESFYNKETGELYSNIHFLGK